MSIDNIHNLFTWVAAEILKKVESHGSFASLHEGYGVLLEEVDELFDEVKAKRKTRDPKNIFHEAGQIAAICIRIMHDFGEYEDREDG